jgi:DNA polymerase-3 subunit delta'
MSAVLKPRENPHLFTHQSALERLLSQRHNGRMHHAYLVCGLQGIGKATFAYHMARELLAEDAVALPKAAAGPSLFGDALPEVSAPAPAAHTDAIHDPETPLFRRVAVGSHTDLLVLSPAMDTKKEVEKATIGVDVSRKLMEFFSLTPAESRWRVAIIDAVDQLNANAANAILKMLEEPPAHCILLLVCHNPVAILPTIRSRCQTVRLQVPSPEEFAAILRSSGAKVPAAMAPLYMLAAGSPGRALQLKEHDASSVYKDFVLLLHAANGQPLPPSLTQLTSPKNKALWHNFRYLLDILAYRVCVPSAVREEIFDGEHAALIALREQASGEQWFRWARAMRNLLNDTDTFHLDKHTSLRMLLHPERFVASYGQAA